MVGLAAALLLARDGHRVTVLERDPTAPPDDPSTAWEAWTRRGVAQFVQPHSLFARFRRILDDELPEVVGQLVDAGCLWVDPLDVQPPSLQDRAPRPGDDRFRFVTGRRPVVESVLARAAAREPGVTVRRGVGVRGLVVEGRAGGVPHVGGVRTSAGDELRADLVVDAMGRHSPLADWLTAAGATPPEVASQDCGFVYHTRYFSGRRIPRQISPPVSEIGTISVLTLPGDNGTWSVTVWGAASDRPLRGLRDPDRFARVLAACPLHAHWVRAQPISAVLSTAGILDRYRRFVVGGRPVATGVAAVGDAWACTNPSAGRGMTIGLLHAQRLRDVVRTGLCDPAGFALAWDEATESAVTPFYRDQIRADRIRIATMDALREGTEPPPPDPAVAALSSAMLHDAEVFRGVLDIVMCLARPDEVLARPGLADRVDAFRGAPVPPIPGPDRAALVELLR